MAYCPSDCRVTPQREDGQDVPLWRMRSHSEREPVRDLCSEGKRNKETGMNNARVTSVLQAMIELIKSESCESSPFSDETKGDHLSIRIESINARLSRLEDRLAALDEAVSPLAAQVQVRLGSLETRHNELRDDTDNGLDAMREQINAFPSVTFGSGDEAFARLSDLKKFDTGYTRALHALESSVESLQKKVVAIQRKLTPRGKRSHNAK